MKKLSTVLLLGIGALSCLLFLCFGNDVVLPVKIGLKILPDILMCLWVVSDTVTAKNWQIAAGLLFAIFCDTFMAFPGSSFVGFGILSNMIALVLYIFDYCTISKGRKYYFILPGAVVIGIGYAAIFNNLGNLAVPTALYSLVYIIFLWRALVIYSTNRFSKQVRICSLLGSICLSVSDLILSLTLFNIVKDPGYLYWIVMLLWWSGLFFLMLLAHYQKKI